MNANHFIKCVGCGAEFQSLLSGAVLAIGCTEMCPFCGTRVDTPVLSGDRNFSRLQAASGIPMIREFGQDGADGYVFMGRGRLQFEITSPPVVTVLASYDRNISRALDLLDIFYKIETEMRQVVLSTVYISVMTSYECLTDDLLKCMRDHDLVSAQKGRPSLHERRTHLFKALGYMTNGHITALRYLYAFRNCLTHNAGLIDEEFVRNIKKIDPSSKLLSQYQLGAPLHLEASTATSFADSLQQVAHSLFPLLQAKFDANERG